MCASACAVSALHFRYPHTKTGTGKGATGTTGYQNCPVLPKLITSCAVASRLPPQVPISEPDELGFVDRCGPKEPRIQAATDSPLSSWVNYRIGHCRCFAKRNLWSVWILV